MIVGTIEAEFHAHTRVIEQTIEHSTSLIIDLANCIGACFQRGNKLLLCGNGGSAAAAQHVAAGFINRFRYDRGHFRLLPSPRTLLC